MRHLIANCLSVICIAFTFFTSAFASEQLIIEPDAGRKPIISAIQNAKSSVDLVMYGLTDSRFTYALINAKKSGKRVNILLEPSPYKAEDENTFAIKRLQSANVNLQWPSKNFKLTHQKTFIIDQHNAIVMTFNLTHSTFKNQRNFALVLDDPAEVEEISKVFTADWQHKNISVHNPNLIWSPDNSHDKILDFINNAKSEIKIYAQDLSDYKTIGALARAAQAGKKVAIITSNPRHKINNKLKYLKRAGVNIGFSKNYIIHAKVILVDHDRAILGSINLTQPSMENNRELSVITHDRNVIETLENTFDHDWHDTSTAIH